MTNNDTDSLWERLFILLRSFWAKPTLAVIFATLLLTLTLWLDQAGASARLAAMPWPFSMTGETVKETATSLATIVTALLALFFSITLIVLTMAASSLGVRLIDRWIANPTIQTTLSLLLALLAYSVLLIGAVDPDGVDARIPRLSVLVLMGLLVPTIIWLAYAFHYLSRLIHVDTSAQDIGHNLHDDLSGLDGQIIISAGMPCAEPLPMRAAKRGYVEHINLVPLVKLCSAHDLRIQILCQEGDFMLTDDTLLKIWPSDISEDVKKSISKALSIGGFRTDRQGARFRTMLLAEIAARAMSPAVNDYYTAYACIDHLAGAFAPYLSAAKPEGWIGTEDGRPRVLRNQRQTQALLENPLRILRHCVAPYPAMSLYLGKVLVRLISRCQQDVDADFLKNQLSQLVRAALEKSNTQEDRDALNHLLDAPRDDVWKDNGSLTH
ncbi:MAG: DUF2254 family protein [Litorimonas sp.]